MEENNVVNILERLKDELNISTDIELSKVFGVKPSTISTWKKRNTINYKYLIIICLHYDITLKSLLKETSKKTTLPVWTETQTMQ